MLLWALLGWTRGGLSRLASIASALLGVLGGEMQQNVAVAKEWLVFVKKCCCGYRSGGEGYPSSSLATSLPEAILLVKLLGFYCFGGHPGLRQ